VPAKKLKIIRKCSNCGKDVVRIPSHMKSNRVFCDGLCYHKFLETHYRGKNNPCWRGGKHTTDKGYIRVRNQDHSRAVGGYVLEHILVMEKKIGRPLNDMECVHHIDGNPSGDR
jgi:hypothetical protein